ncbi:MAG: class I SAM-dependent methyltransferase [Deltaproteobacteria bacterium]|nr:class I SAM-dependent methyltransferase [Deltaproteobacteria bacterium]
MKDHILQFAAASSAFAPRPDRAAKFAEALEYWPGKFSEHSFLAERLLELGYENVIDCGGTGSFKPFLPGVTLTLANPAVNGIDASELPFENDTFDAAISTHTLEHVVLDRRGAFLDEMLRVSRNTVHLIFPFGEENREIDDAKTEFVYNSHQHDKTPRVTPEWLVAALESRDCKYVAKPLFNRTVHFLLALMLPINTDKKRRICRWINERWDVLNPLGDPYDIYVEIEKR